MSFSEGINTFVYWMIDYDLKQVTPLDFSSFQPSFILNFSELSASPAWNTEQKPPLQLVSTNQMLYVERGDLILYVGEEKFIPKAPCLIFLPPAKPYSILSTGQDIMLYLVPFSLNFLHQLDNCLPGQLHFYRRILSLIAQKKYLIPLTQAQAEPIEAAASQWPPYSQPGCSTLRLAVVIRLISLLLEYGLIPSSPAPAAKSIPLQVTEQVTSCPEQQYSVQQFAQFFYLSANNLQKKFKQETGMTLMNFINSIKMAMAQRIMTDTTPKKTARQLGYSDFSYFCKLFKRAFHENPAHYYTRNVEWRKNRKKY